MLLSSLIFLLLLGSPRTLVSEAEIQAVDLAAGWVRVGVPENRELSAGTELVLVADLLPVGRFRLTERESGCASFARTEPVGNVPRGRLRAWLVWTDVAYQFSDKWPTEADLVARIERVGPGARVVWISAGATSGVHTGTSWWKRVGGQPVARFDVLSVEPDACFCSVVPLAANAAIRRNDRVALWPSPGQRRTGAAVSAVSYVEVKNVRTLVWVAAPRGVKVPGEPHLDFFHGGKYVGHAVVESADDLFWYARLIEGGPAGKGDGSGQMAGPVAVGDLTVIRTEADIAARRFAARIFETSPAGAIINAGEADGIDAGQKGQLYREGVKVGDIRIARLQRSYSIVQPVSEAAEPAATRPGGQQSALHEERALDATPASKPTPVPAVGDVVRFGGPPAARVDLAEIDDVVDGTLFSARVLARADVPVLVPLLLRTDEQGGAVALVLAADGQRACGLVLEDSLATPLHPGAVVQQPSPAEAAEPR